MRKPAPSLITAYGYGGVLILKPVPGQTHAVEEGVIDQGHYIGFLCHEDIWRVATVLTCSGGAILYCVLYLMLLSEVDRS